MGGVGVGSGRGGSVREKNITTQGTEKGKITSRKSFRAKEGGNVALQSPKISLNEGHFWGHVRATWFAREMLPLIWKVCCFQGWKLPQRLYNRVSLRCFKDKSPNF